MLEQAEADCLVLYRQYCDSQYDCKLTGTSIELLTRKMSATRRHLLLRKKQKTYLTHLIFRLQEELKNPEMRRLMQLPGMRMRDAYRLAHYDESLHRAAQAVEQGVVQRIQQRAARPAENGIRPGGAATVHPDVASMTRAQREALERRVLHGAQIEL